MENDASSAPPGGSLPRKGIFSSHLSAGLLTTGLAACVWAYSNTPLLALGLIGLTPGIVRRRLWDCFYGFWLSTAFSGWLVVFGARGEVYDLGFAHLAALFAAQAAASVPLREPAFGLTALVGNLVGTAAVGAVGFAWQTRFPPTICVLEVWEFLTILYAVPIAAVCTWWPVDYAIRKTAEYEAKASSGQAEPPT